MMSFMAWSAWSAVPLVGVAWASLAGWDGDVEKGRVVFEGQGNCLACHTVGEEDRKDARGPDLGGVGGRAAERAAEFGLEGPNAGLRYLIRSVIRPDVDVLEDFNPMPESWLPSGLSDDDIRYLIAYMQSLGGPADAGEISVSEEWLAAKRQEYQRELQIFSFGDPAKGKTLFEQTTGNAPCSKCHMIDGSGIDICPDLTLVNKVQRPGYILESILDSSSFLVRGYKELMIWDDIGVIHVGLVKEEDEETITLITDDEGTTEVLWKDEIEEQAISKVSKMPGNFAELLTAEQVMNLVAFILRHDLLEPSPPAVDDVVDSTGATGANGDEPVAPPSLEVFGRLSADQESYRRAMERGDPRIGARIYAHNCVMCHGTDGTGTGFNAVHLETKPANHTDDRRMSKTDDRLLHGVVTRGGMKTGRSFLMPPWGGKFAEREIWDIVAHLRTLHADLGQ